MNAKAPDANDILREHGPDFLRESIARNGHRYNGTGQTNAQTPQLIP